LTPAAGRFDISNGFWRKGCLMKNQAIAKIFREIAEVALWGVWIMIAFFK